MDTASTNTEATGTDGARRRVAAATNVRRAGWSAGNV